jgi:hypothetical protein
MSNIKCIISGKIGNIEVESEEVCLFNLPKCDIEEIQDLSSKTWIPGKIAWQPMHLEFKFYSKIALLVLDKLEHREDFLCELHLEIKYENRRTEKWSFLDALVDHISVYKFKKLIQFNIEKVFYEQS